MIKKQELSDQEKARRAQATQRITIRHLPHKDRPSEYNYECEIETESPDRPLPYRDLSRIIRAFRLAHRRALSEYRLSLRQQRGQKTAEAERQAAGNVPAPTSAAS